MPYSFAINERVRYIDGEYFVVGNRETEYVPPIEFTRDRTPEILTAMDIPRFPHGNKNYLIERRPTTWASGKPDLISVYEKDLKKVYADLYFTLFQAAFLMSITRGINVDEIGPTMKDELLEQLIRADPNDNELHELTQKFLEFSPELVIQIIREIHLDPMN
jgi:hypothetical protein